MNSQRRCFMFFRDRKEAGRLLAKELEQYKGSQAIILALPRGGVVVGYEIAKALSIPLDVIVPRKVGAPFHEELACGAVTEDGSLILNQRVLNSLGLNEQDLKETIAREQGESKRRILLYREGRVPLNLKGKTAILVDDGIATGSTMQAAIVSTHAHGAKEVVVAVPVLPYDRVGTISEEATLVYLDAPMDFYAVGQFYRSFDQTSDEEVIDLLRKSLKTVS